MIGQRSLHHMRGGGALYIRGTTTRIFQGYAEGSFYLGTFSRPRPRNKTSTRFHSSSSSRSFTNTSRTDFSRVTPKSFVHFEVVLTRRRQHKFSGSYRYSSSEATRTSTMLGRLSPLGKGNGNRTDLNVVSYNILSSSLASPSYFLNCKPENLDAETRFRKIVRVLKEQVKRNAVICLQEVSLKWSGKLHSFFQKEGYYFISNNYTKGWQGYMGSAVAFPTKRFTADEVEIVRVSDTKSWPRSPPPSMLDKVSGTIYSMYQSLFGGKKAQDHWELARNRVNTMIMLRLKCENTGKAFCIGTYHMPCMFWAPKVMVIHAALASQKIQDFAKDDHCILAGDFNFKPGESTYKLVTTGSLDKDDAYYPEPLQPEESWKPELEYGMESAYASFTGSEPDFTNNAQIRNDPPFVETLDYIFISPSLSVKEVVPLKSRDEVNGPLPNDDEPSDHILIGATFDL